MFLVRHAIALGRSAWDGDDALRPLTKRGERQALGLIDVLAAEPIRRVLTSRAVRCRDTVLPLAMKLGLEVRDDEALFEGETRSAVELALEVAGKKGDTVLCSHGDVIPEVLRRLERHGLERNGDLQCAKGSTWRLDWDGERFTHARYEPPTA